MDARQQMGRQAASGIYGQLGTAMQMGRQAASGIYGQMAGLQMQGAQGAAGIYDSLSGRQMQRQMTTLGGLQSLYANPAFGMAGMNPDDYALAAGDYMSPLPSMSWGDALLGGVAGGFEGVSSAYKADPDMFRRYQPQG
jgi:hypothetical protein